ncbi:MAG: hypothetical protein ACTHYX_09005 [Psychrobacter sp.]|uniref:hypothetical protein n=1 Tax=Psychrobacter sp. TaxID=56811 RepID=UPI003F9BB7C7
MAITKEFVVRGVENNSAHLAVTQARMQADMDAALAKKQHIRGEHSCNFKFNILPQKSPTSKVVG